MTFRITQPEVQSMKLAGKPMGTKTARSRYGSCFRKGEGIVKMRDGIDWLLRGTVGRGK